VTAPGQARERSFEGAGHATLGDAWRRRLALWAAAVGLAVLAGACGGDPGSAEGDVGHDTAPPADTMPDPQCLGVLIGTPCDDGNPCTTEDKCIDGVCRGALRTCDDGDPCTDDRCDPDAGCVHTPNTAPCNDGNACTVQDRCTPDGCRGTPVSDLTCSDGDPCTVNDNCVEGVCVGTPNPCNDLNPCTRDFCDARHPDAILGTGCVHEPIDGGACDDGNPCTVQDACLEGACVGVPDPGAPCADGDLCTRHTTCQEDGTCGGGDEVSCDDANPCTIALCDPAVGCRFPPDTGAPCDDGDLCTTADACDADGRCRGVPKACQPQDQCMVGTCDPATGDCVVVPRVCDDGNPCTTDTCESATGCVHAPRTGSCDDGDLCTTGDVCVAGACVGTPKVCDTALDNACQESRCDPATGICGLVYFDGSLCHDSDPCTASDTCSGGACVGVPVSCHDGDPCTVDWCDPATGACVHHPLSEEECGDLALERSNEYRALVDLPLLRHHELIMAAAEAHCVYWVMHPEVYATGLSAHNEVEGYEGFTGVSFGQRMAFQGYTGTPMFEVMAFMNDPVRSVDAWMATLYHRIPFVVPRAWEMGYGAAQSGNRRCDTIDFAANPVADPAWEGLIIPFPPDQMIGVPTWWDGLENPQPPLPNPYPSGPILTVTFAQTHGYPAVILIDSDIHGPDGPVPHVANSPSTDPDLCCGVITLYPNHPLDPFTTYTAVIAYSRNGVAGTFEWSFTTGTGSMGAGGTYFLP